MFFLALRIVTTTKHNEKKGTELTRTRAAPVVMNSLLQRNNQRSNNPANVPQYPTRPMLHNMKKRFKISKTVRTDCELLPAGKDTIIRVMRVEKEGGRLIYFFVVKGFHFRKTGNKFGRDWKYKGQIAYAECCPGWVEYVWVNDGKEVPTNARGCGISSLLTRLCLMDPVINNPRITAKHPEITNKASKNLPKNVRDKVDAYCQLAFVGLEMAADPKDAAFGYLSAARKENYEFLIVQERLVQATINQYIDNAIFNYYNILTAGEKYDPITGRIGPCECDVFGRNNQNNECYAFKGYWYFCK